MKPGPRTFQWACFACACRSIAAARCLFSSSIDCARMGSAKVLCVVCMVSLGCCAGSWPRQEFAALLTRTPSVTSCVCRALAMCFGRHLVSGLAGAMRLFRFFSGGSVVAFVVQIGCGFVCLGRGFVLVGGFGVGCLGH